MQEVKTEIKTAKGRVSKNVISAPTYYECVHSAL